MKSLCLAPNCRRLAADGSAYCQAHAAMAKQRMVVDSRPSASRRGYGHGWRTVRAKVLAAHGIPRGDWHLYDVDHNPPYDPARDPNHLHYQLTPYLHADHSRKTCREDGGLGNKPKAVQA